MPTIRDAARVNDLATDRYLLQRTKLSFAITDENGCVFEVKHLGAELQDLLRREVGLQVAAIEEQITALGFSLSEWPTDPETADLVRELASEGLVDPARPF